MPKRIRVGGNVQSVHGPRPLYPVEAKAGRVQGVVRLTAVIGKEGSVTDIPNVSGHPLLIPAAVEAVRNWRYRSPNPPGRRW